MVQMKIDILQLMKKVKDGQITPEKAYEKLKFLPFEDLNFAKLDTHRAIRKGFSEVVFGQGKSPETIRKIVLTLLKNNRNIIVTRCSEDAYNDVKQYVDDASFHKEARMLTVHRDKTIYGKGLITVITAGTLDIPVAEEAALTAETMGHKVERIFDVGVAGIHRLFQYKDTLLKSRVVIVIAGMEGALPSVISGLIAVPVIAVPTSIGYGTSFGGISALLAMLNSCSSGVVVVNIDNGFGAAYAAALINT